jgi:hypothetical protein
VDDWDWAQEFPLELVEIDVAAPIDERAPTATQVDVDEHEMPSRL